MMKAEMLAKDAEFSQTVKVMVGLYTDLGQGHRVAVGQVLVVDPEVGQEVGLEVEVGQDQEVARGQVQPNPDLCQGQEADPNLAHQGQVVQVAGVQGHQVLLDLRGRGQEVQPSQGHLHPRQPLTVMESEHEVMVLTVYCIDNEVCLQ